MESKATGEKTLFTTFYQLNYMESLHGRIRTCVFGVTGEVSLIYGTCLLFVRQQAKRFSELHQ